jgi:hypothetical protein
MSDRDGERDEEQAEIRDRQDAMISAGLDGELEREDRERLDELLASSDEYSARARSFQRVDEELRSLVAGSMAGERLATTFASLRARLEVARSERAETSALEGVSSTAAERRRRWGLSSAFAAAAALVVYLVLPATKPVTEEPFSLAEGAIPVADGTDAADAADSAREGLEEDLALVLGYGDETSEINAISNDDLDVIERLELLDFLSAREMEERG